MLPLLLHAHNKVLLPPLSKYPLLLVKMMLKGPKLDGPMAPEISLENQRPAEYVFSRHVQDAMRKVAHKKPDEMADAAD